MTVKELINVLVKLEDTDKDAVVQIMSINGIWRGPEFRIQKNIDVKSGKTEIYFVII